MERQRQKRILGFIINMKLLIKKYGLRRVKFGYRHLGAILLGGAITSKKAADEHVFDDEIFWAFFEKIHIDLRGGFEFDEGFSFKCNFDIHSFLEQFKTTFDPLSKINEILKLNLADNKPYNKSPLGGKKNYNPYELWLKFENLTPNWGLLKKLWMKNQKEYIRRRLRAIRMLWRGFSREDVIKKLDLDPSTLIIWMKTLVEYGVDDGLIRLAKEKKLKKEGKLSINQEQALIYMINHQSPTDYGYTQYIFTAKILREIVMRLWNIEVSDQTIYNIFDRNNYSYQKAHRDYEHADYTKQHQYAKDLLNVIKKLKEKERLVFFDEFSVTNRTSLFYGWARRNGRLRIKSNEKNRKRINGFLSVDGNSGEIYLEFSKKSKIPDVVNYMYNLIVDSHQKGYRSIVIILDNHTTHKGKMKAALSTIKRLNPELNGFKVNFLHTPPYSPDFNLAEYLIHQVRLKLLHHQPTGLKLEEIINHIMTEISKQKLQTETQIRNTINHILKLGGIKEEQLLEVV